MPIGEDVIHNIPEYIQSITNLKSAHSKLWYRGHSCETYSLQPSIYRPPYSWRAEAPLLHQFKARAARFVSTMPLNNYEWFFIMQHHATPTRLLDWSENALVALAFATQYRRTAQADSAAIVWCLNPTILNSHVRFSEYEDEPIPNISENKELQTMFDSARQEYPIAIIGPQNTDRIIAQRGVFTLFPNKDSFSMESLHDSGAFLHKIIIPKDNIDSISSDLYYIGMTESTLFPELDSISKELRKNYERQL